MCYTSVQLPDFNSIFLRQKGSIILKMPKIREWLGVKA
jgi:hypothetical protein